MHYTWSYASSQDESETVLKKAAKLPEGGQLVLRLKAGAQPVTALIFNSNAGKTEPNDLPLIMDVRENTQLATPWKLSRIQGSRVFLALFITEGPEASAMKALRRQWEKTVESNQKVGPLPSELYVKLRDWRAENTGGSALAGDLIQEVGAVRAGGFSRDPMKPGEFPPQWQELSNTVRWNTGQHPVLIFRFVR